MPHAQYVARKGQINAWDNPDFVDGVKVTGNLCNWRCVRRQDQAELYRVRDVPWCGRSTCE